MRKADTKIIAVKIVDFKRIEVAEAKIDLAGNVVMIGGENANGKTSMIDAIEAALSGPQKRITRPVRQGATQAKVVVQTDKFTVVRTWDPKPSLKVVHSNGEPVDKPAEFLQGFLQDTFTDPMEFIGEAPIERRKTLCAKAVPPVDWDAYRSAKDAALKEAEEAKKLYEALKNRAAHLEEFDDVPSEEVDISGLQAELVSAQQENAAHSERKLAVQANDNKVETLRETSARLEKEIKDLQERLAETLADIKRRLEWADANPLPAFEDKTPGIVAQINSAAETNKKIAQNKVKAEARKEAQAALDKETAAARRVVEIEEGFKDELSRTKFPVDGIGFDTNGNVTLNGVPFDQASQAEQIRVGMSVALSKKGALAPVLIRNGSLLDKKSLALIADLAEEHGAQVFIERVADAGSDAEQECAIVILDGNVKSDEQIRADWIAAHTLPDEDAEGVEAAS